jgi:IS30 family transposase
MKHEKSEQIKALIDSGFTDEQIVTMMVGTTLNEVRAIRGGKAAADMTEQEQKRGPKVQLDEEMFNKAKKMHDEGMTYAQIAVEFGFSAGFVYKCLRFKTYEDLQEFRRKDAKDSSRRKQRAKARAEGKVLEPVQKEVQKEVYEEAAKPAISQELIEIRSVADSLARIAEALESIKELQVYKKRGLFHK